MAMRKKDDVNYYLKNNNKICYNLLNDNSNLSLVYL